MVFYLILVVITICVGISWVRDIICERNIEKIKQNLENTGDFKIEKSVFKYDSTKKNLFGLVLDDENNKIAFIENGQVSIRYFNSVLKCDVSIDGETITQTNRGSQLMGAAVGGVLLGGIGALIGGLSGKQHSKSEVKEITLKIIVDDLKIPMHSIILFSEKSSRKPEKAELQIVDEWHSLLQIVISRKQSAQQVA